VRLNDNRKADIFISFFMLVIYVILSFIRFLWGVCARHSFSKQHW